MLREAGSFTAVLFCRTPKVWGSIVKANPLTCAPQSLARLHQSSELIVGDYSCKLYTVAADLTGGIIGPSAAFMKSNEIAMGTLLFLCHHGCTVGPGF